MRLPLERNVNDSVIYVGFDGFDGFVEDRGMENRLETA